MSTPDVILPLEVLGINEIVNARKDRDFGKSPEYDHAFTNPSQVSQLEIHGKEKFKSFDSIEIGSEGLNLDLLTEGAMLKIVDPGDEKALDYSVLPGNLKAIDMLIGITSNGSPHPDSKRISTLRLFDSAVDDGDKPITIFSRYLGVQDQSIAVIMRLSANDGRAKDIVLTTSLGTSPTGGVTISGELFKAITNMPSIQR